MKKPGLTLIRNLRNYRRPLVFTNGAFRAFHVGHLACLDEAKRQSEPYGTLIVGVNSDESLEILGRPCAQSARQRAAVVQRFLRWPDTAIIFNGPTPIRTIHLLRPDVLVKGADYAGQEIVGAEFVRSYGGRVVLTPFIEGLSATRLLSEEAHEKSPAG